MVALELLVVACPLLILAAWPRPTDSPPVRRWAGSWTIFAVAAALLYAALLLIVVHIPAVHRRGTETGSAPLWLAAGAGHRGRRLVRRFSHCGPGTDERPALVDVRAQEIGAFIGLLSLFGAWGAMTHTTPSGFSAAWDQRLGGLVMMATGTGGGGPAGSNNLGSPAGIEPATSSNSLVGIRDSNGRRRPRQNRG